MNAQAKAAKVESTSGGSDKELTLLKRAARRALMGQTRTIQIGRSSNTAGVMSSTEVQIIPGDDPPKLVGLPCLKTNFKNGPFQKTLYTPSTLRVVVGKDWEAR
jgi:hypothetical protein